MVDYSKRGVRGFIVVLVFALVGAVLGYFFRMVLARSLSVQDYGVFYATYALISLPFLFRDFGLGQAVAKYIPELLVKGKVGLIKYVVGYVFRWTLILSVLLSVLVILLSSVIAGLYIKQPGMQGFVVAMAVVFVVMSFASSMIYVFVGFQKHTHYAAFGLVSQVLQLLFLFLFFGLAGKNLVSVALSYFAAYLFVTVLFLLLYFRMVRRHVQGYVSVRRERNTGLAGSLWRFGFSIMFVSIGSLILQYTDTILITFFKSSYDAGIYNAAVPIAYLLVYVGSSLSVVLIPMTSELWAKRMKETISASVSIIYKYALLVLLPFCTLVSVYSVQILDILFGPQYVPAYNVLRVLIFGTLFYVLAQANFSALSGMGKPNVVARITVIGAAFNVVVNLFMIPLFGILGAAITTAASYILVAILSFLALRKHIRLTFRVGYLLRTIGISAVMLLVVSLLKGVMRINVYIEAVIMFVIAVFLYLGLAYAARLINMSEVREIVGKMVSRK